MIIGAILERADPRDAVVIAPWHNKKSLNELPHGSVIGTSSTRRIAQLKLNYPQFIYKNIRGNMNTRWEKLNNRELGYDAMIAAVAGLQRLKWTDRISQIIEPDLVLYAIGQGALGIECRHNDIDTIRMLSVLNHEPTVIRCIAERAFLRRSKCYLIYRFIFTFSLFIVGGGCSIPNAVRTVYNDKGLTIYGILLNLDGSRFVKDSIKNSDLTVPMTTTKHGSTFFVSQSDDDLLLPDDDLQSTNGSSNRINVKRKRTESDVDSILIPPPPPPMPQPPSPPLSTSSSATTSTTEVVPLLRHYAHVCGVNINETVLENAELCGTNLAVKLMQMGADSILEEIRQNVVVIPTP
jgi:porphobilinogen deaminase